jgi:3-oxoacyl-[acyl-carrier protein] reductase
VIRALAPFWREAAKQEAAEGKEYFRKIVNITSTSGTMGNAGQANYSSAKAGVTGLTKTIAKEWGQFKINCNAVAFGFVETRLTQAKEKGETIQAAGESTEEVSLGIPEQLRQMARLTIPLGRPAEPSDAAGPVMFLCSEYSNFIHGQVINVTGGQFNGMYC